MKASIVAVVVVALGAACSKNKTEEAGGPEKAHDFIKYDPGHVPLDFIKIATVEEVPAATAVSLPGRVGFDEDHTQRVASPIDGRAVAILIKLDSPGPIFFVQRRYGFNQQPFRIIKFRTMRTLEDGPVIRQAQQNDPRLTRIGRWLRRWNIDEVPQLFNVLTGDMSLVGPRPHALSHDREYEQRISRYARRHNVRPGITGWAQIHGYRGETDTEEKMRKRVEYDLYYIDNWSLWLDFKIIVRTVLSRSAYRNAY